MPQNTNQMTLGEVLEIQPGDKDNPSWVNGEFCALVSNIVAKTMRNSGKTYWTATLSDPDDPGIQLSTTFFANPSRYANRVVRFSGQGMSRTEYSGTQQLGMSQKTLLNIVGNGQQSAPPARAQQQQRGTPPQRNPHTKQSPRIPVDGQTIGMALKLAGEFMMSEDVAFNAQTLHERASDIIRISDHLMRGNLAPKSSERQQHIDPLDDPNDLGDQGEDQHQQEDAPQEPPPRQKNPPGPDGSAFPTDDIDPDSVPF